MKYVGIDLGTTNSAICSFDGEKIHLYKSPEQHDVTPSAIFIDRRGNKYVGSRAYNSAAKNPDNAAVLFKRLMGTSTPVKLSAPMEASDKARATGDPGRCSRPGATAGKDARRPPLLSTLLLDQSGRMVTRDVSDGCRK